MDTTTHKSACILCSVNCGINIEVDHEKREFVKITGDKDHPSSQGYICQKATRLNYYMNQERLTSPLRKKSDGSFEEIDWDTAIEEIATKLVSVRDTHGGTSIAYAGGGGQGNHLAQMYGVALRRALKTPYIYSSIAQEKTGNFWVHGKLFGKQNVMYTEPIEDAEFGVVIGANPIQSHGMARAKRVIGEISRDKNRTLVVIDPRETETAKKADYFIQVKPGRDAWLMSAMLAIIIQEDLIDHRFIAHHTNGYEEVKPFFMNIPIREYIDIAGVDYDQLVEVTRKMAAANTVAIRSDLGIEMSLNSTLNAYLKRLLFLLTGNFNKQGCNHLASWFVPLIGHSKDIDGGGKTMVTGAREIARVYPPNVLAQEIDNDHPDRLRAIIVDSCNPVLNWVDTHAQIKAYKKLDIMVVIDVAMTETAMEADYILPASNQYEKYEAAFFTENFFHLRKPIFEPLEGTLSEPEIYTRLLKAMGALHNMDLRELTEAARKDKEQPGKGIFQTAFMQAAMTNPKINAYGPIALRESLGKTMPEGADSAAFIWMAAQLYAQKYPEAIRKAGIEGKGGQLGEIMFNKILESESGVTVSAYDYEEVWNLMKTKDKRVNLFIPELLNDWLTKLPEVLSEQDEIEKEYPFNLIAGERRTYNANAIIRNMDWAKTDQDGRLKINPIDANTYDITEGDSVELTSSSGSIQIVANLTEEVRPGVLSMPHGKGLNYGKGLSYKTKGAMPNILTKASYCDPLAKTPYHKNVRVKICKAVEDQMAIA
jgi:anaerobic selenocysteine-containing dehydrogenase